MTKHDSHITEYTGKASVLEILQLVTGSSSLMSHRETVSFSFGPRTFQKEEEHGYLSIRVLVRLNCVPLFLHTPQNQKRAKEAHR